MDLSKERILMCDEAIEIQKHWKPKVGDYVWKKYSVFGELIDEQIWDKDKMSEIIILTFKSDVVGWYHATNEKGESRTFTNQEELYKATCVWIPRQDQLQKIASTEITSSSSINMLDNLYHWWDKSDKYYALMFSYSMEQLWLAFIMDEMYNKIWNPKTQKWTQKQ